MQKTFLKIILVDNFIIFICVIVCLYFVFKKKKIFSPLSKKADFLIKGMLIILIGYMLVHKTVPGIKDLPYLYKNEYIEVKGMATCNSIESSKGTRTLSINNKNQKLLIVVINGWPDIKKGSEVTVKCLPNSKYGIIIAAE